MEIESLGLNGTLPYNPNFRPAVREFLNQSSTVREVMVLNVFRDYPILSNFAWFGDSLVNSGIRNLEIRDNAIGESDLGYLPIGPEFELESLILEANQIGAALMESIALRLTGMPTLKVLVLENNALLDEGVEFLVQALCQNEILERLSLQNTSFGQKGIQSLAILLRNQPTLEYLDMSVNRFFGYEGMEAFSASLAVNETLRSLNLTGCELQDKGIELLCRSLWDNLVLRELNLHETYFKTMGAMHIAALLRSNSRISSLKLSGNAIGNTGGIDIANSLNRNLRELNLAKCNIKERAALVFAAQLKSNKSLVRLNLSQNKIGTRAAEQLIETLRINMNLIQIFFSSMGRGLRSKLDKYITRNMLFQYPLFNDWVNSDSDPPII